MTTTAKLYINNVVDAVRDDVMAWGLFDSEVVPSQEVCLCWDTCVCSLSDSDRIPTSGKGWISL